MNKNENVPEETFVEDTRERLSPSEVVEQRLRQILGAKYTGPMPQRIGIVPSIPIIRLPKTDKND